tara:strand:+ start:1250 stop:1807 length:558 start_codon:yes stop_codon:yes gene_type:complete
MIGVAGCAQQASGGVSAPTAASIATSSSGNYDRAVTIHDVTGAASIYEEDGSNFSSDSLTKNVSVFGLASTGTSSEVLAFGGYCRVVGTAATSFQWNVTVTGTSLTAGSASTTGTAATAQDVTDPTGGGGGEMGEGVLIQYGGSKAGVIYPSIGDSIDIEIDCSATNAGGTVNAPTLSITINYVE